MEEKFFSDIIDIVEYLVNEVDIDITPIFALRERLKKLREETEEYYKKHNAVMKDLLKKAKKMEKELEESNERLDARIAKWKEDSKEREADREENIDKLRRMSDELGTK